MNLKSRPPATFTWHQLKSQLKEPVKVLKVFGGGLRYARSKPILVEFSSAHLAVFNQKRVGNC